MEYPESERAEGAERLAQLASRWGALAQGSPMAQSDVRALAGDVVAHRTRLFEANARLQANASTDDDPRMVAAVEANQGAIKRCTTMLTEMTAALGLASIPG